MRFGITPLALLLLAVALSAQAQECTDLYRRYSSEHTSCKPPNTACTVENRGVSDKDKALILKLHNDYRSRVATGKETNAGGLPSATNMLEMVWDDELAAVAQKLADSCIYGHDCNNCRKVKAFSVGQNIGKSFGNPSLLEAADWQGFIKGLYDEVTRFDKKFIKPFVPGPNDPRTQYGHFTQMAWATSWKIGCGWATFKEGNFYSSYTVCNYGPAGNTQKKELYDAGPSCSKCPKNSCCGDSCKQHGITSNYPGLCKVINTATSPEGPGPHGEEYLFYCDFNDQSDCARTVEGKEWTVERTAGGNWLSVVLKGGEKTKVMFNTDIATKKKSCLKLLIRTAPNVDGDADSGKGVIYLSAGPYKTDFELNISWIPKAWRQDFMAHSYGYPTSGNKLKIAFEYSVPAGAAPQFVEIQQVSVYDGECVL